MKKATIALASLAIALAAFVGFYERFLPTSMEAAFLSKLIAPISAESISKIRVTSPAGEFVLESSDDGWRLTKPISDRIDPELTARLLMELSNLVIRETIDRDEIGVEDGPTLDKLGFSDAESITAVLEFGGKAEPIELIFGAESAFNGATYLRTPSISDRPDVYIVDSRARQFLEDPIDALRDRNLIRFHPGAIESYVMRTASGEIELAREPDAPIWSVLKPLQARANDEIAYLIIDEITNLRASTIVDEPPAIAPTEALDENTAVFILRPQGGEPIELIFRQADILSDTPDKMTVSVSGRNAVFELTSDFVRRLPATINQLRHPFLGDFKKDDVVRIEIKSPGKLGAEMVHDGIRWYVAFGGQPQPADTQKIDDLIAALNEELIVEFASDTASRLDEFGLTKPLATIAITTAKVDPDELLEFKGKVKEARENGLDPEKIVKPQSEIETKTLRFGISPTNIFLNANYEGSPFIYSIDPAFLSVNAPMHPIRWRSKKLPNFDLLAVRGIDRQMLGESPLYLRYEFMKNKWSGRINDQDVSNRVDPRRASRLARDLG
ncbi:MAG: hypothetical protein ACI8UO_006028, partial [Verrucomicrobiales bacterium]